MYLHSASRLTDKFTLDVCISKCVSIRSCACARACVWARMRVVHACACTHSCIWPLWMYVCMRQSLCIRTYAAWMWASWHVWVYMCFCFLDINRRLNWSSFLFGLCVIFFSEKISTERERERGGRGEKERERERERERGRESRVRRVGRREREQRGRRKMVKKHSRTYLLTPVVYTPNAWLPSLKASTWVWQVCSHSLALTCLTTLSGRNKLSTFSHRTTRTQIAFETFIANAPMATVLKQIHHRPCNKDVLHPWLASWLSTASESRQFSSTTHLKRRLRENGNWPRPPSL